LPEAAHAHVHSIPELFGSLALVLAVATLFAELMRRVGQPGVLGEMLAGVVLGVSFLGVLDPKDPVIHLLAELGVALLLFNIGLETDLRSLFRVGWSSLAVAIAGVVLPFAAGYAICHAIGMNNLQSLVVGASMTATSVGITARVLSDLGRLKDYESRIILGAAVIDDVLGLIILAIVDAMREGGNVTAGVVGVKFLVAFGFLAGALVLGRLFAPVLVRFIEWCKGPGAVVAMSLALALVTAWAADQAGSAIIIGAFAAGVVLGGTKKAEQVEHLVTPIGYFLVPIFFASVGASVDLQTLNPFVAGNLGNLMLGLGLLVAAVATKFAAGYLARGKAVNRKVVGVGMVPRGEVGLIFADRGLSSGILTGGQYSAVTLMVMGTTLLAPPLLRMLLPPKAPAPPHDPGSDYLA
jgi:Kef-type K+ transport system membrane component KefB